MSLLLPETAIHLDPQDLAWGFPPLPSWVGKFRQQQIEAVETCVEAYRSGASVVIGELPTGAGKSLVGEMLRRAMKTRAVYMVSTKQLQSQIEQSFEYADVLWGRAGYATADEPSEYPILNAGLCDKDEDHFCDRCPPQREEKKGCSLCHPVGDCPYEVAKAKALASRFAVLNYRYAMTEMNYVGRFGEQRQGGMVTGRIPLAVADEADVLEEELMGFVEVNISKRRQQQFRIRKPERKTVETAFVSWALQTEIHLSRVLRDLPKTRDVRLMRDRQWVERTLRQVERLQEGLKQGAWVYDDGGDGSIVFRPVKVDQEARGSLWRHADKWLLMSATICSAEVLAADLGLEDGTWTSFSMPSVFNPGNRPIYITPRADMRNKMGGSEWPQMAEAVVELLRLYQGDRVFIPTVSYKLNDYLVAEIAKADAGLARRLVTYKRAAERETALKEYRRREGAVLLAPAMDRGLDLADDDCRCVIIVKVPAPYLGDKQVSARLHSSGGRLWYTNATIKRLVQATGRAVRHEDDWADSYILDRAFVDLYRQHERWFPRWWREGVNRTVGGSQAFRQGWEKRQARTGR